MRHELDNIYLSTCNYNNIFNKLMIPSYALIQYSEIERKKNNEKRIEVNYAMKNFTT